MSTSAAVRISTVTPPSFARSRPPGRAARRARRRRGRRPATQTGQPTTGSAVASVMRIRPTTSAFSASRRASPAWPEERPSERQGDHDLGGVQAEEVEPQEHQRDGEAHERDGQQHDRDGRPDEGRHSPPEGRPPAPRAVGAVQDEVRGRARVPTHPRSAAPKRPVAAQNQVRGSPYQRRPARRHESSRGRSRSPRGRRSRRTRGRRGREGAPPSARRRPNDEPGPAESDVAPDAAAQLGLVGQRRDAARHLAAERHAAGGERHVAARRGAPGSIAIARPAAYTPRATRPRTVRAPVAT